MDAETVKKSVSRSSLSSALVSRDNGDGITWGIKFSGM